MSVYLDTSAYLAVLLDEQDSDQVLKRIKKRTLCSSTLFLVEAERNLVRLARERIIAEDVFAIVLDQLKTDKELFILKDLSPELCLSGIFPAARIPRSSDLVHLRTALWFKQNGGLEDFVTLDNSQRAAAVELGLVAKAALGE